MFTTRDFIMIAFCSTLGLAILIITAANIFYLRRSRGTICPTSPLQFNRGSSIFADDVELEVLPSYPEPTFMQTRRYEHEFNYPYPLSSTIPLYQRSEYSIWQTSSLPSVLDTVTSR
jgi:hypothetical protein